MKQTKGAAPIIAIWLVVILLIAGGAFVWAIANGAVPIKATSPDQATRKECAVVVSNSLGFNPKIIETRCQDTGNRCFVSRNPKLGILGNDLSLQIDAADNGGESAEFFVYETQQEEKKIGVCTKTKQVKITLRDKNKGTLETKDIPIQ